MCNRSHIVHTYSTHFDIYTSKYLGIRQKGGIYYDVVLRSSLKRLPLEETIKPTIFHRINPSQSIIIDPAYMTQPFEQAMQSNDIWTYLIMLFLVQKMFSIIHHGHDLIVFRIYQQSLVNRSPLSSFRTIFTGDPDDSSLAWSLIKDMLLQRQLYPLLILNRRESAEAEPTPVDQCSLSAFRLPRLRNSSCPVVSSDWWKKFLCIVLLLFSHVPPVCLSSVQPSNNSSATHAAVNSSRKVIELTDASSYSADDMIVIDVTQYEFHDAAQYLTDVRQFKPPSPDLPCRYRFREDVETSALLADYVIVGWPRQAFRRRYGPLYNISLLVTNVLKQSRRPTRAIFPIRIGHLLRVGQFSVLPDPGRCWLNVQPGRAYMFFIRQPDWSGFCQISQLPVEYSEAAYERVMNVLTHGIRYFEDSTYAAVAEKMGLG
ncbi:Pro neuregulin 2 membrane bound [Fasciola hepatica]|uniref:Pro neuregulin 2 membrane bound n=1 Tax=Fasciola hepatica TaxID=6192 RepID=A0A4E0RXA7_FASHE|nr:Pro neuregulin 2 membrane bound [Fasciola hepatica]